MSAAGIHNCVNIMIANIPGHLCIWPLVNCHRHGEQVEKQDEEPFHKKSLHLIVLAIFWYAIWTISCISANVPFYILFKYMHTCQPLRRWSTSHQAALQWSLLQACSSAPPWCLWCQFWSASDSREHRLALATNCLEDVLENCTYSPCRISMMADPQLVEPSDMMESRAPRG